VEQVAAEIGNQYRLTSSWDGDDLKFSGSGIDGRIAVSEDSVDVSVKLGFALMMLEGTIRSSIEDTIEKHLTH
jgi:putative polyhydroxyalkanoate system protein